MTLNKQSEQKRFILHALGYVSERSAREFDIIEDTVPLHNLEVTFSLNIKIQKARVVPEGPELTITEKSGTQIIVIPEVNGHCMVELNYQV